MAFCHSFDNGLLRSFGHGRRLTNRQAFSLGVIDLFSVCIEEHLTDCGIVVIHVLEEPLLGESLPSRGLCEGLDMSLREEVVVGSQCYYLTSRKLKGSRNCLRLMRNERRKMKVIKKEVKGNAHFMHG